MCMFINSEKEETLVLYILWRLKGGKIDAVMYQDEGGFFVDRADRYIERI